MNRRRSDRRRPHPLGARALAAAGVVLAAVGLWLGARPAVPQVDEPELAVAQPPLRPAFQPRVPRLLKVGMATDRSRVELPCCQGQLIVQAGSRALGVETALVVEPAAEITTAATYRVQVAALKDERQAQRLADSLRERLGEPSESVFDAGIDLYRVRVGRFDDRAEAERVERELKHDGLDAWIVSERAALGESGFRVRHGGAESYLDGRWLSIRRSGAVGIAIDSGRYRGRILLFLNDRGLINVINELTLEEYLRGVVPREMGPEVYSSLEALKAQTVAARTYTVRNLGEFEAEGYDICATPRCQVFGGMGAEHPLSDRAVEETAGEVMVHGGEVVDALYSSSCGGHTENVEVIFPLKRHPYLRGVPCPESGVDPLGGSLPRGTPFVEGLMAHLLPPPVEREARAAAEERLRRLADLAGLAVGRGELVSLDRRDVRRFIGTLFDLVLDARLFTSGTEASLLVDNPPAEWSSDDRRLAAYLDRTGLLTAPFEGEMTAAELDEMLFQLSLYLGVLESRRASYLSRGEGVVRLRFDGATESFALDRRVATFRGGEYRPRAAPLLLRPGDPVTLYLQAGELVAVVQEIDAEVARGTPGSSVRTWHRTHSDDYLRRLVAERYPEIDFAGFEILERGVSGRVGRIRLDGRDGRSLEVEGLAVRWTLDLPDTLFTTRRVEPPARRPGWLFTGRGHGHGVGMCQLGAYGMGVRGGGYREILSHYYSGVSFTRLELVDGAAGR
ncbi:MAG: SpoIID/LytB domain-containing protein [Thermoanaerobaculia bacterium]|nr:SpoIID/LytB domain-containing protein [Thermoanaerobaculia bacterium]